ncbi:MAG: fibronectin type III domain-containing protein, partial [Pseudomonas sp.]|uniref:fibronectin type III domain-containing protein n=1 Tax=Pseudomonas sp. TaxID=306 RepID=UPI003D6DE87A
YTVGAHTITKTGLAPDRAYAFQAITTGGQLVLLPFKTLLVVNPSPPDHFTPFDHRPDGVSFFWNGGGVSVGEPRYEIKRDGVLLDIVDKPPFRDTTPQEGRDHHYCIRTVDEEFNYSDPLCVTVSFEDLTAPTDPSNVRTSNPAITVSWDESSDSSKDVTYIVDKDGSELGRTKELEFAVTGLESGKRYEFGVTATDKAGNLSNRIIVHYPAQGVPEKGKR